MAISVMVNFLLCNYNYLPVVSLESNLTWKATKVLKFHFFWNRKFELTFSAKFNLYNTPVKVIK